MISDHGYWDVTTKETLLSAVPSIKKSYGKGAQRALLAWRSNIIPVRDKGLTHRNSISNKQQQSLVLPSIFPSIFTFHPVCHAALLSPWNYVHWSIGSAPKCTEASCILLLFLRHSYDQSTARHTPAQKPNKQNKQTTRFTNIWHQPILWHTNKQKKEYSGEAIPEWQCKDLRKSHS